MFQANSDKIYLAVLKLTYFVIFLLNQNQGLLCNSVTRPLAVGSPPEDQDILEFIDTTGYAFLGSISLTISTFTTAFCDNDNVVFPITELETILSDFSYQHFSEYFKHMQTR